MNNLRDTKIATLVAYLILLGLFVYAFWMENKDTRCPNIGSPDEECDLGGGMSFAWSRPEPDDSCYTLLNKIDNAAGYEVKSVKWRRSFLLSTIIVLAIIAIGGAPVDFSKWYLVFMYILIAFVILLGFNMYYGYHIFRKAEGWIFDSTQMIRDRYCSRVIGDETYRANSSGM